MHLPARVGRDDARLAQDARDGGGGDAGAFGDFVDVGHRSVASYPAPKNWLHNSCPAGTVLLASVTDYMPFVRSVSPGLPPLRCFMMWASVSFSPFAALAALVLAATSWGTTGPRMAAVRKGPASSENYGGAHRDGGWSALHRGDQRRPQVSRVRQGHGRAVVGNYAAVCRQRHAGDGRGRRASALAATLSRGRENEALVSP